MLLLGAVGCGEEFHAGPITFVPSEKQAETLKDQPKLRSAVTKALRGLYGDSPRALRVPKGAPLPLGGAYLANHVIEPGDGGAASSPKRMTFTDSNTGKPTAVEGGYGLYRRHCLHCHGINGDGKGPTAAFLWPRPRDFRQGIFKFTSSAQPDKPTRLDLERTITHGLANSAMPAFEALMTPAEIQQVIDFTIFISLRGETELRLIDLAMSADESESETYFTPDLEQEAMAGVFDRWVTANSDVLNPPVRRVAATEESILRGRSLFLGQTKEKLECSGCHGTKADGTGLSWIDLKTYNHYVFYDEGNPNRFEDLKQVAEKGQKKWSDNWGNPLRPANLNQGMYKGGRRPLDIYWRVAKGINGTPMPSHASILKPEQIWDVVNFVLALPYQPELLRHLPPAPATPPAVASQP